MKRAFFASAAVALGLAVAIPAVAQQAGTPAPKAGPQAHFARMCEDHEAFLAGKLAFAEKKLKITDAQKAAWTKFADAARASQAPMAKFCTDYKDKPAPAALPDRLDRIQAMATVHQQTLAQIVPAAKELYAQLTPDQQKTADRLLPGRGMGHEGMMGGHRGGPDGGPGHHGGPGPMKGPNPPAPPAAPAPGQPG
ncbi:hypothetical protein M2352_000412 [Azospirillum fermentarium]|uniref:Spy/CpxP family protein refolding chaperone n=1 Tax=Azospirillum fermentarium TaxID=1233114 RepID=UPI002225F2EE|nr:Spy/CpxP family protein refolding chaperone [Azospirillum fermentarium]MCW2244821.1 hypothetical protein [Azospirillum fermentarium]